MSQLIPETVSQHITTAEFVEWTKFIYDSVTGLYQPVKYYFSSTYKDETVTIDGTPTTFEHVGGLLQVGVQQRDIKASNFDTSIMLMGIDPQEMYKVVGRTTKGSRIRVWRGFYNEQYVLTGDLYLRFTGIITSYQTNEDYQILENTTNLVLNCSSTRYVLQNMFSGRKTNQQSWQQFDNTDTAMNNVVKLAGQVFMFGKENK